MQSARRWIVRVWAAAWLSSNHPEFRKKIAGVFHKVADMAVARTEKYGFFPFTFAPELKGKSPGKSAPGQSIRLARHAADVAGQLEKTDPKLARKLRKFSEVHLKAGKSPKKAPQKKPEIRIRNLAGSRTPRRHAREIIRNVELYRRYGDKAYLKAAETYARLAYVVFCDDKCPLPKARAGSGRYRTTQGKPFPDFYFHGAGLMKAFALLAEAMREPPGK